MKAFELISWLEEKYPTSAAEEWDNVGLLTGDDTKEVGHVFLALDLTEETLDEAIDKGADMIITHHHISCCFNTIWNDFMNTAF